MTIVTTLSEPRNARQSRRSPRKPRQRQMFIAVLQLTDAILAMRGMPANERHELTRSLLLDVADSVIEKRKAELAKASARRRGGIAKRLEEAEEMRWVAEAWPNEPRLN